MTKADLAEKVECIGFSKKEAIYVVESVLGILKDTLEAGDDIKITGFGKFEIRKKSGRKGRNPQTGESIMISSRKVLTFKPSQVLKDYINR
jgi:integration host factor subunit alpha